MEAVVDQGKKIVLDARVKNLAIGEITQYPHQDAG
jgi:hypothetical protein